MFSFPSVEPARRQVSLTRRGKTALGTTIGFVVVAVVAAMALRQEARARLSDLAFDDVLHALDSGGPSAETRCRAGTLTMTTGPLPEGLRDGETRWLDDEHIAGARCTGTTCHAAIVAIEEPAGFMIWRAVGLALFAVCLLLLWFALTTLRRVSDDAKTLCLALASVARDSAPSVPLVWVAELTPVAVGISDLHTDLVEATNQRVALARALEQQRHIASMGHLAASLAHEVKTPLAAIRLRAELMRRDGSRLEDDIVSIVEAVTRADSLATDLLAYARGTVPVCETLDVGAISRRHVSEARFRHPGRMINASGEATVVGDIDGIGRALDNLIDNAVRESAGPVEIVIERHGPGAKVTVIDDGNGVDPAHQDRLFEPFFTMQARGNGLGLALVHSVAVAHGGEARYERRDERSLFSFTLVGGRLAGSPL